MIPRTMKAVLLRKHGSYEQLDFRDDVPVPVPAEGEVLVQIGAAGNSRRSWKCCAGEVAMPSPGPLPVRS